MKRLPTNPPAWVSAYVGLPFRSKGRTRDGVDCWGLVRLVYAERFGVPLPDLSAGYADAEDRATVSGAIRGAAEDRSLWRALGEPSEVGDIVSLRIGGEPCHVGIVVADGRMLHSIAGADSSIERIAGSAWENRVDGFYRLAAPVRVVARRSIFHAGAPAIELPEGATIEELVAAGGIDPNAPGVRAFIGDREVPRERWKHVRPRAGRRVVVGVIPERGGGGKDIARVLLVIAVVVAAVYAGPVVATGLGFTATGSAAAISTAVIGLAGTLAVNALVPPPSPDISTGGLGSSSVSPTITGSRNEARPYSPVPVLFGTHRVAPAFAALPYTEIVGDDQYLRCLFTVGHGPLALSDFRIGTTALSEFDGVEIEVRAGYADDAPMRLYPAAVSEQALSILLNHIDVWNTRTGDGEAEEMSLDVTFPRGVAVIQNDGSRAPTTVEVDIEYALSGTGTWKQINAAVPSSSRELAFLFRTPETAALGAGVKDGRRISWSVGGAFGDNPPDEVSSLVSSISKMSWEASGYVYAAEDGEYVFGIDSGDASELTIDGAVVCSHYLSNVHAGGPLFSTYASGSVTLSKGYHAFRFRVETRDSTTFAAAIGWRTPSDGTFSAIPASAFYRLAPYENGPREMVSGYEWRLFDTRAYDSTIAVTAATADQIRRSISWAVPRGKYDVRVSRRTADTDSDRVLDEVYWTALRSINYDEPIKVPALANVALRIKATDQLNGMIENFNLVASSILPDYDAASGSWITRPTSNPASHYRAVLQGPGNRSRVGDARIDLDAIEEWHEANRVAGFESNVVFDYDGTVLDRLSLLARLGRAAFGMRDGKFSIVRDRVQTTPVQHLTPRNSRGFKGRRAFPDLPHGLRVQFLNAAAEYQRDERIVLDDGFVYPDADGVLRDAFGEERTDLPIAERFETIELFGVTSADLAWRHGRYYIAVGRLRPETFEVGVDWENLVATRGDLVLVTHDVPLLGTGYGRIHRIINSTSGRPAIADLDAGVEMEAGRNYAIRVRKSDGTFVTRNVVTEPGLVTSLWFEPPFEVGEPAPEAGDLFGFGERTVESREYIIKSIAMGPDLSATLTLVDHAPAVHDADTGEIPPFDSGITRPPEYEDGPEAPIIDAVRSDDGVMIRGADGTLVPRIVVYLRSPASSNRPSPAFVQARYRESGFGAYRYVAMTPVGGLSVSFLPVEQGVEYDLAIRYVSASGKFSAWTTTTHEVSGHELPPPDVQSFSVSRLADGTRRYSWELGTPPPDVIGVRIRYAEDPGTFVPWESMADLVAGTLEGASPTDLAVPGSGSWLFAIKMVDASGLESVNAVYADADLGPPPRDNVALIEDARAANWPGDRTNCTVGNDGELFALSQGTWATLPSKWSEWGTWTLEPYPTITYEHPIIDAGFVFDCEPTVEFEVEPGQVTTILFDYSEDGVVWAGYAAVRTYEGRTVRGRYFRFKATAAGTGDYPVATFRQLALVLRAPTIVEVLDNVNTATLDARYRIGTGWIFAPISAVNFAAIETVSVTFNGTGAGWSWELLGKDVSTGPELRIFNSLDLPADATIDIIVRGIRSSDGSTSARPPGALAFSQTRNSAFVAVI